MEWCFKLEPQHPCVTNTLTYIYILLKKYTEASDACSDTYSVNRVAKNYFRNWAISLVCQKLYSEAVMVIKEAIKNDPLNYSI